MWATIQNQRAMRVNPANIRPVAAAVVAPVAPVPVAAIKKKQGVPKGTVRKVNYLAPDPKDVPTKGPFKPGSRDGEKGNGTLKQVQGIPRGEINKAVNIKKGIPVVSHRTGKKLDKYKTLDDVETAMNVLKTVRHLKRRGFLDSSSVNVLPAPGSLGEPVVGNRVNGPTVAELTNAPNAIGRDNEDPQSIDERKRQVKIAKQNPGDLVNQEMPEVFSKGIDTQLAPPFELVENAITVNPQNNLLHESGQEVVNVRSIFKRGSKRSA